jgi:hypothetical protein
VHDDPPTGINVDHHALINSSHGLSCEILYLLLQGAQLPCIRNVSDNDEDDEGD